MPVTLPTQDQLRRVAERIGFELTDDELDYGRRIIIGLRGPGSCR